MGDESFLRFWDDIWCAPKLLKFVCLMLYRIAYVADFVRFWDFGVH